MMATLFEQCSTSSTNAQPGHAPVDASIFVRYYLSNFLTQTTSRLVGRLGHEALAPRSHPDATPALAALIRLRRDPVRKADFAAPVTDGVGLSQDRVAVQRRGALSATAHAGQVPAVSGPGHHQQRPAAEVVAEVAQDRGARPPEI